MRIQFWGTRGSIATPGPNTARYGGNTSCIEVRSSRGTLLVIDCGTGGRALAQKLMSDGGGRRGTILISHSHWDHIQGIPFFAPLYVPGNEWDLYGPKGLRESMHEVLAGQMQYTYFPVSLEECPANIRCHDLLEGSFAVGEIQISARYLNHPALTLGYRVEVDGATLVYACDHEPYSRAAALGKGRIAGQDLHHAEFIHGADLLIHDAQYTAREYPEKIGWGHSPVEYVLRLAEHGRVKRVALAHHDPYRDDDAVDRLMASVRRATSLNVFAACEGDVVELKGHADGATCDAPEELAEIPAQQKLASPLVMLRVANPSTSAAVGEVLRAESIRARVLRNIDASALSLALDCPAVAIVEHDPPRIDGVAVCRAIRRHVAERQLPVLLVAEREDTNVDLAAGVSDWLIKPFTVARARTKVRTWLLRNAQQKSKQHRSEEKPVLPFRQFVAAAADRGGDRIEELIRVWQKEADDERLGVSAEKAPLLWMYGREIAAFDTPDFTNKLGRIITQATSRVARRAG